MSDWCYCDGELCNDRSCIVFDIDDRVGNIVGVVVVVDVIGGVSEERGEILMVERDRMIYRGRGI